MPTEILDSVYDVTWKETPGRRWRSYVLDGNIPTVIDTCLADSADRLVDEINQTGVAPERLVITHGDPDHVGAYDEIVAEYDLETVVPEQSELYADTVFSNGDTVGQFEAVHVPGHAVDSYVLVDEDASFAVFGDVVVGGDLRGLPEGTLVLPPEVYSDDLAAAERNLETLLEYEFEAALLFHGSSVLENASEQIERYVNFPGKP
ncbi:MBL fold metallo-hydrolase [Saliphagus sp. GCM10025334]